LATQKKNARLTVAYPQVTSSARIQQPLQVLVPQVETRVQQTVSYRPVPGLHGRTTLHNQLSDIEGQEPRGRVRRELKKNPQ